MASRAAGLASLTRYCERPPHPQNALDVFAGAWASKLPPPLDGLKAGEALLFADGRLQWALEQLGGVAGKRVLELGPLEGGHTYMLDRAGAGEILAIEANPKAYLKCLIVKELLGMPAARFACGDFVSYLEGSRERFDMIIASGVLYHMLRPVELIARIAARTDALYLWTHYYDPAYFAATPVAAHRAVAPEAAEHGGYRHDVYRNAYGTALGHRGFCGGSRGYSYWLARHDIIGALKHFGLDDIRIREEEVDHQNGPAFSMLATRTGRKGSDPSAKSASLWKTPAGVSRLVPVVAMVMALAFAAPTEARPIERSALSERVGPIASAVEARGASVAQGVRPLGKISQPVENSGWRPAPPASLRQAAPAPRKRSVARTVLGAIVGAAGGFFAGGYTGAWIEGNRCHCDDPGLKGFMIGAPVGAVLGGIAGGKLLF